MRRVRRGDRRITATGAIAAGGTFASLATSNAGPPPLHLDTGPDFGPTFDARVDQLTRHFRRVDYPS